MFKGLSLEHVDDGIIDKLCQDTGRKIAKDGGKGYTKRGRVIIAKNEVDLSQPLKRGTWILTAAKQKVWIRYHYEKQPRKICPDCFVIDHNEELCEERAWNIFIFGMTEPSFQEFYAKHAHLVKKVQEGETVSETRLVNLGGNGFDEPEEDESNPRKYKRSRGPRNYVLLEMNSQRPNSNLGEMSQLIINGRGCQSEIEGTSHGGYDLNMEDVENGVGDPNETLYHLPATVSSTSTTNQVPILPIFVLSFPYILIC